jgi:hypothetical protein
VALAADDLEHAGMAVPSEPSRAFALLNPPTDPPTLVLTPNVSGTTAAVALVRVDTNALARGSDIGDFAIATTATRPGHPVDRFSSSLGTILPFATAAAFVAGSESCGYIGGVLYVRLPRDPGQTLGLAVVVRLRIGTNVPLPPDASKEWHLDVGIQRLFQFPPTPPVTRTFAMSTIPTIPHESAMPNPTVDPAPFEVRRIDGTGTVLLWSRSTMAVRVGVRLTNSSGQTSVATQVVP